MEQTVLVSDITKWKSAFYTPEHKVKLSNFTGEPKSDTPRFHYSNAHLNLNPLSKFEEKEDSPVKYIQHEEIIKHNKDGDLWAVFDRRVYDISNYVSRHPELLMGFKEYIGKDSKCVFSKAQPNKKVSVFFQSELLGKMD